MSAGGIPNAPPETLGFIPGYNRQRPVQNLFFLVSEHLLRGSVPAPHVAIDIECVDRERRSLNHSAKRIVHLTELFLGTLPFGDISRVQDVAADRGFGIKPLSNRFEHPPGSIPVPQAEFEVL